MTASKNWNLPSRTEAWDRLRRAAPPAWVLPHCRSVESLAAAMADAASRTGQPVDRDLILVGALLHDVGRSITQDVRHAHLGADLLREDNVASEVEAAMEEGTAHGVRWPEAVVRIVERHTGAGIQEDEALALGLPARDYVPSTLEERIVAHADNLWSGSRRLRLEDIETKYTARGLQEPWTRIKDLHEGLCRDLDVDVEDLAAVDLPDPGRSF